MHTTLFNIHDVVLLITMYQCLLFPIFLLTRGKEHLLCNALLAGFFLANAAIPLDILINFGAGFRPWAIEHIPNLFYVFDIGYWIQGPLLLWYIRSLSYRKFKLGWPDVILIAPYLLFALHQLIAYHTMSTEAKVAHQQTYSLGAESVSIYFLNFSREVLRTIFAILCVIELRKYQRFVKDHYRDSPNLGFDWLKILVYGSLALWGWALIIAIALIISKQTSFSVNYEVMGLTANYLTCFLISVAIISVSRQAKPFAKLESAQQITRRTPPKQNINLEYVNNLEKLMENEHPYLDTGLTLESLAKQLSISPRTLSTVINGHYDCNFFEFINRYRINAAKVFLLDEKHKNSTVLDIMYEVGFSSKATFNTAFKKAVGMTPREFKKENQSRSVSAKIEESQAGET